MISTKEDMGLSSLSNMSTIEDKEYDIINEIEDTLAAISKSIEGGHIKDKIEYIRLLIKDLDHILSDDFMNLRYKKIITFGP